MKKTYKAILLICVLLFAVMIVACGAEAINGIRFDKEPKTVYVQGQELDFDKAVLVSLTGNKTENISMSDVQISGYDRNTLGKQTVTVKYKDVSTSFEVTVIPRISVEGAVTDYFVKEPFNCEQGRIKVADDNGVTTAVPLNDSRVTVEGFDSSSAGKGKTVTVKYGEYSGTFNVNVHEVSSIELSAKPGKTSYLSHETEFDVTGAYFTVKSVDGTLERMVALTKQMVYGFDPSAATIANLSDPLPQTVKLSYLEKESEFDIKITFSGVSLMKLRAAELINKDPATVNEEQGNAALDAMRAYFNLTGSEKKLIEKKEKNAVALIATVYGYNKYIEAKNTFSDTFDLVTQTSENDGDVYGIFDISASTYDTSKVAYERLQREDEPFVALSDLLRSIESEFSGLKITDGKDINQYMEFLCTEEGLDAVREILGVMITVHRELSVVPENWEPKDLQQYMNNIKNAVSSISGTEYNPYLYIPYFTFFDTLEQWREKGDCYRIIYSYYLEFEDVNAIAGLWEKVPFPGDISELYRMFRLAKDYNGKLQAGTDTSIFMYYYHRAKTIRDEVINGDDELLKEIYETFDFENNVNAYLFVGDKVNNIAYIYFAASMVGNEQYEEFMHKYLTLVGEINSEEGIDFENASTREEIRELLRMYMAFTPAQRYAVISSIHCEYRLYDLDELVFIYKLNEKNEIATYNLFAHLLIYSYREELSDEAFDLFNKLLQATELYGLRYRSEEKAAAFMTEMESIIAAANKLGDKEIESFKFMYDDMVALYEEAKNPRKLDVSAYKDQIDGLIAMINTYYEIDYIAQNGDLDQQQKLCLITLQLAIAERIDDLKQELLSDGNEDMLYSFIHTVYAFDTDRAEDDQDLDLHSSLEFVTNEIRANYITTLVLANVTALDENGKETEHNAYTVYFNSEIGDFFADAVELMYAAAMEEEDQLDRAYVLEMMEKFRKLDSDDLFAFVSLSANILYYDGISGLLTDSMSEAAENVFNELLVVEELYTAYITQGSDAAREAYIGAVEKLKSNYEALADKSGLADFEEMYSFYADKCEELKASAEEK